MKLITLSLTKKNLYLCYKIKAYKTNEFEELQKMEKKDL